MCAPLAKRGPQSPFRKQDLVLSITAYKETIIDKMNLFWRYWFWFARMQGTLPKSSKTPHLKGRLNRCVTKFDPF